MTPVIKARLDALPNITLHRGGHSAPSPDAPPSDVQLCVNELVAFLAGEPHSASPKCQCPVIGAAMMRFNDRVDDETRQRLVSYASDPATSLAARSIGTAGDGYQTQRGYLAADFAVRIALPIWLDAAGASDDAARLRELPELTDPASSRSARKVVLEIREGLPDWWTWRQELRAKVKAAVLEAMKDKPAADAAADAATAAAAAADAVAADATAVAAVAADVAATADATTAAAAAADAVAADATAVAAVAADATTGGDRWTLVYDAVYKAVRAKLEEKFGERWPAAIAEANTEFLQLLERMVALGEDERGGLPGGEAPGPRTPSEETT